MIFSYLPIGAQKYTDFSDEYARFILKKQLTDASLWRRFVEVFRTREDVADNGWRGEYFGKMMRGACLTYRYLPDPDLYDLLERTVRDLLAAADDLGRISTYPPEKEFRGWDMWCRKYVLVGCLHFYDVCKDDALKEKIMRAMRGHLDYIAERIGEGKISITDTSEWYGGMNSASILEPVLEMYKLTKEPRYLALAEHILQSGGCKAGSVVEAVEKGMLPHEFPTTKAYETMSYFEGILDYYEVTGEGKWLALVEKFAELVAENEVTVIGSAGCRNEHFDHAVDAQTERYPKKYIMQETCVTVTWMRLQERLLRVTGRSIYADRIELSALNALYGAVNLYDERQLCKEEKRYLEGVPFDSYSPLVRARRGIGIGGFKRFAAGGYYGCCACIGAAGTALFPLSSAMRSEEGLTLSFYHEGRVSFSVASGEEVTAEIAGSLRSGEFDLLIHAPRPVEFALTLRIPKWSRTPVVRCGEEMLSPSAGYLTLKRRWQEGDRVRITLSPVLERVERNGKFAFAYGPFILARDEGKEAFFAPRKIAFRETDDYAWEESQEGERIRLRVREGNGDFLFTDYASCGKHWTRRRSRITVWQKRK